MNADVDALIKVLKEGKGNIGKTVDALINLNPSDEVRHTAAQLIVDYANSHNTGQVGPDGERYSGARYSAALALAKLNVESTIEALIDWLNDWDAETRTNVALALGKMHASRAVTALLDRALNDDYRVHLGDPFGHPGHPAVRCAAVIALRHIAGREADEALARIPSETFAAVEEWKTKFSSRSTLRDFGYMED